MTSKKVGLCCACHLTCDRLPWSESERAQRQWESDKSQFKSVPFQRLHPFNDRNLVFSCRVEHMSSQASDDLPHARSCLGACCIDDLVGDVWVEAVCL